MGGTSPLPLLTSFHVSKSCAIAAADLGLAECKPFGGDAMNTRALESGTVGEAADKADTLSDRELPLMNSSPITCVNKC